MSKMITRYPQGMATPLHSDLASVPEGTRFLARRPFAVLGLACFGMLLAQLAPLLQLRAGLPNEDLVVMALTFVATLPMDMYLVPRFLVEADAHAAGGAGTEAWTRRFEARWLPAVGGRLLLYLAAACGFLLFVLPMFAVFFFFGWGPLRMLLRDEGVADAARGSFRMMARGWRRVLPVVLLLALVFLTYLVVMEVLQARMVQIHLRPDELPSAWVRLTHPFLWAGNFLGTLLNLWTSAVLLALFRRVEAPDGPPPVI